jgi:hypothetical protein
MAGDLWLPTTGIHLEREEAVADRSSAHVDWICRVKLDGGVLATMRAHEYRGLRATVRTMSLVVLFRGDVAIIRKQGKDWAELEHRIRTSASARSLGHIFDSFIYQRQAVA